MSIISNAVKAEISYRHEDKIQGLFKNYVRGNLGIGHFSLNIFFGNGQSIFLSPTPKMAEELCKHNFVNDDSNYKPDIYKNLSIYPWRSVERHQTDGVINFIKEEKFQMHNGMMIVRDLGKGRYVMYSIATHRRDNQNFPGQFSFLFHCKANYIAQLGDFLYDNLLPTINEYGYQTDVEMPKLSEFKPISLESSLCSEQQIELYNSIKDCTNLDLIKLIEKRKGLLLKLINNGKVDR